MNKVVRAQTTVSIASDALEVIDDLARTTGISRSRLLDLATRRFARWAAALNPGDVRLIAEYESSEPVEYVARPRPIPSFQVQVPPPVAKPQSGFVEAVSPKKSRQPKKAASR